jgi:hypothetical protein
MFVGSLTSGGEHAIPPGFKNERRGSLVLQTSRSSGAKDRFFDLLTLTIVSIPNREQIHQVVKYVIIPIK